MTAYCVGKCMWCRKELMNTDKFRAEPFVTKDGADFICPECDEKHYEPFAPDTETGNMFADPFQDE